jgi:pimeloyl-ACP methyl ester carboxylesterase
MVDLCAMTMVSALTEDALRAHCPLHQDDGPVQPVAAAPSMRPAADASPLADAGRREIWFIPGFMCNERLFASVRSRLASQDLDIRVLDLSRAPSIEAAADMLLRQSSGRFALFGLSMGGIVSLEVMRRAACRVSHLALLNTTPRADAAGAARRTAIARVREGYLESVMRDEMKPKYLADSGTKATTLATVMDMALQLGPEAFIAQSEALMMRRSYEDVLDAIECPTLVLTGADDQLCPPQISEAMSARIRGSRLRILKGCGHLSTLEDPDAVASELETLLAAAPVGARPETSHLVPA